MTDTVKETWHRLAWKDNAGREDEMVGPMDALQAQKDVLDKNDIDYVLEDFPAEVEKVAPKKRAAKKTATKKVADKDLEVR